MFKYEVRSFNLCICSDKSLHASQKETIKINADDSVSDQLG